MRILVIEDDAHIRDIVAQHLRDISFAVDTTDDGEEGSTLGRLNDYDIIITDYMLPKKDARQIIQEIRSHKKTTPILVLTVRSETSDKVELLDAGADDYLTKPFSLNELEARVRALLRRPKALSADTITLADLVINTRRQEVTCGKKSIYLTRKEFSLLEYLARNQGSVLSRGMIMEHVWDQDSDPFSNTIEAHILNLRKKLGRGYQKMIHTVPGRGYKLDTQA